jgi:hypothetical protein
MIDRWNVQTNEMDLSQLSHIKASLVMILGDNDDASIKVKCLLFVYAPDRETLLSLDPAPRTKRNNLLMRHDTSFDPN